MLNKEVVDRLKERYQIHPLMFSRSLERAKTDAHLFDILDTIPKEFPIVWCDNESKWVVIKPHHMFQDFIQE
jgi:hypothetical protein